MADPALQALLDPGGQGMGIVIERRVDDVLGVKCSYYVVGNALAAGRARWVECAQADSDATKNTAIRAALTAS